MIIYIRNIEAKEKKILEKAKRVSYYDSENLIYNLIENIFSEYHFTNLGLITHLPLKEIFKSLDKFNENEKRFVTDTDSHIDFMIYNKVTKQPVLAIEVDGYAFHKEGSKQHERDILKDGIFAKYDLPLMRLNTTGSGEKEKIVSKFNELCINTKMSQEVSPLGSFFNRNIYYLLEFSKNDDKISFA